MSDSEVATQEPISPVETIATNGAKRGRGRPKKGLKPSKDSKTSVTNNGVSETNGANGSDPEPEPEIEESILPKKRGRKPRVESQPPAKVVKTTAGPVKRGRGRPKKSAKKASPAKKGGKRGAPKKRGRSESVEDEAEPNDDNSGDEEDRPDEQEEDEEEDD